MAHISLWHISTIYSFPLFCYIIHKIAIWFRHWSLRATPGNPASASYDMDIIHSTIVQTVRSHHVNGHGNSKIILNGLSRDANKLQQTHSYCCQCWFVKPFHEGRINVAIGSVVVVAGKIGPSAATHLSVLCNMYPPSWCLPPLFCSF
jgi:hypothetical protein